MSGGYWNYMGRDFAENYAKTVQLWNLMAAIEHELDWGICSDTCRSCARIRVPIAIELFFDSGCADASVAIAIVRDQKQNRCARCGA